MRQLGRIIVLFGVLAMAACDENPVGPTPVTDVTWKLEVIERSGSAAATVPNPEQYTLRLEADGRLSIRADCNTCNGRYTLAGNSLAVLAPVACTRAFCGLTSLDTSYVMALEGAQSLFISNSRLVIQGSGFTLRFRN